MSAASEPPSPVKWRANVVVPVCCVIARGAALDPNGPPLRIPVEDGASGVVVRVGDTCGEEGRSD
jgi:hypothetical protein